MVDLTRADMIAGLREVVTRLNASGHTASIRIIGGAAMLLRYDIDRRAIGPLCGNSAHRVDDGRRGRIELRASAREREENTGCRASENGADRDILLPQRKGQARDQRDARTRRHECCDGIPLLAVVARVGHEAGRGAHPGDDV